MIGNCEELAVNCLFPREMRGLTESFSVCEKGLTESEYRIVAHFKR